MTTYLYRSAAIWTALGLLSGLFYREFTKLHHFTGHTQLSVVHTHTLALGTIFMLVLLALDHQFQLALSGMFRWGVHVLNGGLLITAGMLTFKGSVQVLGKSWANSPALAGIAGMGHMALTAAMILLFLGLGQRLKAGRSG